MKLKSFLFLLFFQGVLLNWSYSQVDDSQMAVGGLFQKQEPMTVQLRLSMSDLRKNTNDSTYIASALYHSLKDGVWDSIPMKVRTRGRYRLQNCYYLPIKIKLKKKAAKATTFEGNEELKVVLPCLIEKNKDDFVLKEYLAYKLYEVISPFHFKTRLANISIVEKRGKRVKRHEMLGFFIEDVDDMAKRLNGKELKRLIHPLQHDDHASLQNALFQFLIGNTDYSTKQQHNEKLVFVEKRIIPVPYDFDMSGLVNANYAFVANIQNTNYEISEVTERLYKGYKRDEALLQQVRQEYLSHKDDFYAVIDGLQTSFQEEWHYTSAKNFIGGFFEVLENDKKFEKQIVNRSRTRD